jgi:hypothetical protein
MWAWLIGAICVIGIVVVLIASAVDGRLAARCNEAGGVYVRQHGTSRGACLKSDTVINLNGK